MDLLPLFSILLAFSCSSSSSQMRTYNQAAFSDSCRNNMISLFCSTTPEEVTSHYESLQHVSHFHLYSSYLLAPLRAVIAKESFMRELVVPVDSQASRCVHGNMWGNFHRGTCFLVPLHEVMHFCCYTVLHSWALWYTHHLCLFFFFLMPVLVSYLMLFLLCAATLFIFNPFLTFLKTDFTTAIPLSQHVPTNQLDLLMHLMGSITAETQVAPVIRNISSVPSTAIKTLLM